AHYLIARNSVSQPEAWLKDSMSSHVKNHETPAALMALAWQTPWEQARLQRMVRLRANQRNDSLPLPELLRFHTHPEFGWFPRTRLEFPELLLALRLY